MARPAMSPATPPDMAAPGLPREAQVRMISLPRGTFVMGSKKGDKDADSDERPAHEVTVVPFAMDETEVTVAAYKACGAAGGCKELPTMVQYSGYSKEEVQKYSTACNGR